MSSQEDEPRKELEDEARLGLLRIRAYNKSPVFFLYL